MNQFVFIYIYSTWIGGVKVYEKVTSNEISSKASSSIFSSTLEGVDILMISCVVVLVIVVIVLLVLFMRWFIKRRKRLRMDADMQYRTVQQYGGERYEELQQLSTEAI